MKAQLQPELPRLARSNGQEQLDIAGHELGELQTRLASQGKFISVLTVRREGGYRVTIQKRRHADEEAVE